MRAVQLIIIFLWFFQPAYSQSVLSNGTWYKFAVDKEGIYKITYSDLEKAGVAVSQIDPRKIRIFGNEGGMLPQLNSAMRPIDLQENHIKVVGEEDGKFNSGDYILFFAQGPDKYTFNIDEGIYDLEKNKYAKENFYFLTISDQNGLRISPIPNMGSSYPQIESYNTFSYFENEEINLLHSGREWFGRLNLNGELNFLAPYTNLYKNGELKVYAEVMAQSTTASSFTIKLNNYEIGSISLDSIFDYNQYRYRYTARGKMNDAIFSAESSSITGEENGISINIKFNAGNASLSRGYFNRLLLQAELSLQYDSKPLIFSSIRSIEHGIVTYNITNTSADLMLWNVTEHGKSFEQEFLKQNSAISFGALSSTLQKYALFNPQDLTTPTYIGTVENQDIKGLAAPDLLIVTHPDFKNASQKLAEYKAASEKYAVQLVTTENIFNEFSSGRTDITAIRDYIKYLFNKSPGKLKYVLLVGKGSYDYMGYGENNTNFIPIYQSYNSLYPLKTYSSDDYYGFLEDHEGEWPENFDDDHTLEVAVGRLPVTTLEEANQVVDKIINYSSNAETLGDWRTKVLFVADDGDGNLHNKQANDLAEYVDASITDLQVKRLFLDDFKQTTTATGQESVDAREALRRQINEGTLIVNFTGHGGERQWMDEKILDYEFIDQLSNKTKLPLFVTATCEFGRHDDPMFKSGGERLVLHPTGGGIALVTTSRPVYASSNYFLNNAFYKGYKQLQDQPFTVGDLFLHTKNNSLNGINNRNFSLLGDPSVRLQAPQLKIAILNSEEIDTLRSYQRVKIAGEIKNSTGTRASWFNGEAKVVLTDKPVSKRTRGDEYEKTAPFSYTERSSTVFRGSVSVSAGYFESTFIVPQDIDHKLGNGELHIYAFDVKNNFDAADSYALILGGTDENQATDTEGPKIKAFLGDTTFNNGDIVSQNVLLLLHLTDESGINITGRSLNSEITATFEGERFVLNEYYTSKKDDFKSGWVAFPMENIKAGVYTMKISGTDIYNNMSVVSVDFVVGDGKSFVIEELVNIPNPVMESTLIIFTHNRTGEAMDGELIIYDSQGAKIYTLEFETEVGQVRHKVLEWDRRKANGTKLEPGIYYYNINVRSKLDGAKAGKFQKLIILN